MNDLIYAQLYRTEIEAKLLKEQTEKYANETTQRSNFAKSNRRFHRS